MLPVSTKKEKKRELLSLDLWAIEISLLEFLIKSCMMLGNYICEILWNFNICLVNKVQKYL